MMMLFDQHEFQVNVYMMLLIEDENDHLVLIDHVKYLPQKMYNHTKNIKIDF
jgi:hypothetical protein